MLDSVKESIVEQVGLRQIHIPAGAVRVIVNGAISNEYQGDDCFINSGVNEDGSMTITFQSREGWKSILGDCISETIDMDEGTRVVTLSESGMVRAAANILTELYPDDVFEELKPGGVGGMVMTFKLRV